MMICNTSSTTKMEQIHQERKINIIKAVYKLNSIQNLTFYNVYKYIKS